MNNDIFILNGRDNIILDLLNRDTGYKEINSTISSVFFKLNNILISKNIKYSDLKHALVPSGDKREVVLVFDREKINSSCYGADIFNVLLPLLNVKSVNSFLHGDYIDIVDNKSFLKEMLLKELKLSDYEGYCWSNQFYFVYINNNNDEILKKITDGLRSYSGFVNFIDVTYRSIFKDYISRILANAFVKSGQYILMDHPDDVDNQENENKLGFYFEKFNYKARSLQSTYYNLFLSYKIEQVTGESDHSYSVCALTPNVLELKHMFIKVSNEKLQYLKMNKEGIMKRLEFLDISSKELENKIKDRIKSSYFFNLRFCDSDDACLLSVFLEFNNDRGRYKVVIGLKYIFSEKQLFLTTMF